jgi:hypothetical protein
MTAEECVAGYTLGLVREVLGVAAVVSGIPEANIVGYAAGQRIEGYVDPGVVSGTPPPEKQT